MKLNKIFYLMLLISFFGCKSTKEVKNNVLDVVSKKEQSIANLIELQQIDLNESEIILIAADLKKPIVIVDAIGNKKIFENTESVTIKTRKEVKEIKKEDYKKNTKEIIIDKSIVKEEIKSTSDVVHYKWIFICIAVIVVCVLIIYLKSKLTF